ncbi:MAG: hypothetical protein RPU51_07845, partial [Candidatus Sedimenticola sp. (ex Thyasira tokunagai)]
DSTAFRMHSLYALHRSLPVAIPAIQPRLRLSGTNRLGFQPSMAISVGLLMLMKTRGEAVPAGNRFPTGD